jgi:hypothetical protein
VVKKDGFMMLILVVILKIKLLNEIPTDVDKFRRIL